MADLLPPSARAVRGRTLALALALAAVSPLQAAELSSQDGLARAPGAQGLLFREQHLLRAEAGRPLERLVVYRCPAGPAFARKRLDYRASTQAPAFLLEDRRSGYREGMRRREGRVELFFHAARGGAERSARLRAAPAVADAGFDEFVRAHWQELLDGRTLPLEFAIPSRLRTMDFAVARRGTARVGAEEAVVFRLRLDGLLGLVAPHIDVAYSLRSRRLLRFEGLSNMRDARGARQLSLRIDFPAPARPVAAAAWQAALSEPLVAACGSGQQADTSPVRTPELAS